MNFKRNMARQPRLNEDQAQKSHLCKGRDQMTEEKINPTERIFTEIEVSGNFETVEGASISAQVSKENVMFELDLESLVDVEFADATFDSEQELAMFLKTLTEAQLSQAEVIADDDTFVVFFPVMPARVEMPRQAPRSGFHFDTDAPRPTVRSAEVPELVGLLAEQF